MTRPLGCCLLLLALGGCTLGYPLRIEAGSAGVSVSAPRQPSSCLYAIHVFERPASRRQANAGPDAPPIWTVRPEDGRCVEGFPNFRYGEVPEGMQETAPPPPLVPGRTYWLRGYTGGGIYSGEFTVPPSAAGR